MDDPRTFYEQHVLPIIERWRSEPLDESLAKLAAVNADQMADYVFSALAAAGACPPGCSSVGQYRNHLIQTECDDYALIRDVADGHKHVKITKRPAKVTNASQTAKGSIPYGMGLYSEGVYGGSPQIVITLNDGRPRALSGPLKRTLAMWSELLTRHGL